MMTDLENMMKRGKNLALIGLVSLMLVFLGCSHDADTPPRYTVWTDVGTYTEFQSSFKMDLNDGMFLHVEFANEQFSQISSSLVGQDDYKHSWTKSQLKDWFVGRGFDDAKANEWSAWLISVNHGMIVSRRGNLVYIIIK
ncbi:MAG: hypothetical protein IJC31_01875 [Spirochaetaceae bacterium]|nr:hypothetical protein [Spirochaetaceae bacterium]